MDTPHDTPLGQAVRFLIDRAGKIAAEGGYGQVVVTFQAGKIEFVNELRSHRFPNVPCPPPIGRRSDVKV